MAVIRFEPTWVVTANFADDTYNFGYPLTTQEFNHAPIVAFDMQEINRVMNAFPVDIKKFAVKSDIEVYSIGLYPHYRQEAPVDGEWFLIEPTPSDGIIIEVEEDYYKIDLDQGYELLGFSGPYGATYLSFQNAINRNMKGFKISTGPETLIYEVFIELEGNFENPRPTIVAPLGGQVANLDETIRFRWNHHSPLEQESFEIRYRVKGSSDWTIVQHDTNNRYYDLAPNTLTTNEYEWQVRTTSEYDFASPWSLTQVFNAAAATPSPIFLIPLDGDVIEVSDLHVEWDSIDQYEYQFELRDSSNNVVWSDSKISTNKEIDIENILENNRDYKLRLRVNRENDIFSSWAEINISVDYTEPAQPDITLTPDTEKGSIKISINNPMPTGTEPAVTNQELFRREQGREWIKLENLLANSEYIDHTPASEQTYDYRVVMYGNNNTSSTSDILSSSVKIKYSQLNLTSSPEEMIKLYLNPSISFNNNYSATIKKFTGRKKPVGEFGKTIDQTGSLSYLVKKKTLNRLYEFLNKQETLLYRDERGRKMFVVVTGLNVPDDTLADVCSVSISFTEVHYKEGIE